MLEETRKGLSLGPLKKDKLRLSGDRMFYTLQGEGVSIGKPVVFLRLHECNLKCVWCDSWYTWDKTRDEYWNEATEYEVDDVLAELLGILTASNCHRVVITGGEPLMQKDALDSLLKRLREHDWSIEVEFETNGTIPPSSYMMHHANFFNGFIHFNVSPKTSNSNNPKHQRMHLNALNEFAKVQSVFKFVVADEADVPEILEYAGFLPQDKIILMPEGTDLETLNKHMAICDKLCKEHSWRLTPRLHIQLYGDARAT